jgi:hypothetical protein
MNPYKGIRQDALKMFQCFEAVIISPPLGESVELLCLQVTYISGINVPVITVRFYT